MQQDATPSQDQEISSTKALEEELAVLRERVRSQDQLLADRADQIADLRTRLDREGEERRKLAAILTDQRPRPIEASPTDPVSPSLPRSWWPWRR